MPFRLVDYVALQSVANKLTIKLKSNIYDLVSHIKIAINLM